MTATEPSTSPPASTPRERLLDAAFGVFADKGYAGTSTREICRLAEVNGAALNYHWGSKDKLWLAVTERCAASFEGAFQKAIRESTSPMGLVESLIDAVFEMLARDPRPVRIVLWATLQADVLDYDTTVRAFDSIIERSIEASRAMQGAGLISPDVDVDVAGPLLHSQIVYAFADRAGHQRFYGKDLSDPDHAARFRAELIRSTRLALGVRDLLEEATR